MKHSVVFDSCDNHWDNALPLGNSVFGCMLFYERDSLFMPLNHYEVYYNRGENELPEARLKAEEECTEQGAYHREITEMADRNQPPEGEPFCLYRTDRTIPPEKKGYGTEGFANTHPQTGELDFEFADSLKGAKESLVLYVEDAKATLTLSAGEDKLTMDTIIAREDLAINSICQTRDGLVKKIKVTFPLVRNMDYEPTVSYEQTDKNTVVYTVKTKFSEKKTFVFSGVIRFCGAEVKCENTGVSDAFISIIRSDKEFKILTAIFTDFRYQDTFKEGLAEIKGYEENIDSVFEKHAKYWEEFFARSSVTLPDKLLEKVYYVNQYALDCCSGKDGIMRHHACGLNGLWDIRRPNLWGSLWYWDVNIQAAFAGVFSSNRLDLAKVFSDGLISYCDLAEKYAQDVHNLEGISADYPYPFYYSCWPWCAQYLWFLYEYSLDEDYLRNDAYPVFIRLCKFFEGLLEYDEGTDTYGIYPDICPEQGPLSHSTTITIACVKYLFEFTLEAAKILGDSSPLLDKCREMLSKLPPYALAQDSKYGVHLKDSVDASDNLWVRHPSMLMPVFPIGEYGNTSEEKQIVSNTVDFLEENCETGIFGCSWIAAAAARIGRGQSALRILYEKGIDHMLRSNGLTAEVTERFMNHCLIMRQPLYYPCMMEFTGEMLAAVNEMLMQSHGGVIKIFPALPDGDKEYGRMIRNAYSITDYDGRYNEYDAWKTVRFDKLLAKGAFEVSASLTDGSLDYILIKSKKGGKVTVACPYLADDMYIFCDGKKEKVCINDGVLSFETKEGEDYLVAHREDAFTNLEDEKYDNEISEHLSIFRRHIYIGEDKEAVYNKKLDSFTRDRLLGDTQIPSHTVYKFDFTKERAKNYKPCFPQIVYTTEKHMARGLDFLRPANGEFDPRVGYGFDSSEGIEVISRGEGDALRCDFAEGTRDAEFIIEMPRGQYEILVISGDSKEDSVTIASCGNSRTIGGKVVEAGEYQCEVIPYISEYDEPVRVKLSTKQGYKWKINAIMVNGVRDLL